MTKNNYYAAAAILFSLSSSQQSSSGAGGGGLAEQQRSSYYCDAFTPPIITATKCTHPQRCSSCINSRKNNGNSGARRTSGPHQPPHRKSGVFGLSFHSSDNDASDENYDGNCDVAQAAAACKMVQAVYTNEENNIIDDSNDLLPADAEAVRSDRVSPSSLSSAKKIICHNNDNDITVINSTDGANTISVINMRTTKKYSGDYEYDDEEYGDNDSSVMDEEEVDDVAAMLMEQPPNVFTADDDKNDGDEYDGWRQEKGTESILSLAEKRARIRAIATGSKEEEEPTKMKINDEPLPVDGGSFMAVVGNQAEAQLDLAENEEESLPDPIVTAKVNDEDNIKEEKSNEFSPLISTPSLYSIVDGIKSVWIPLLPKITPTNSDLSSEQLAEINAQLQKQLTNQKSDLGRLRRKINTLKGELLRTNQGARKNLQDQADASFVQVIMANETVALLEEQVETLTRKLAERAAKYEQTLEDKERIAAEYGYVAKSYIELKRSLDTITNDWQGKVQKLTKDTQSLEEKIVQYQEDGTRWRKKCIEKAKMLDESTARIKELQSIMDESLMEIRSKQENIDERVSVTTNEEKSRSKEDLQRLSDEYEFILSEKSKKIGKLRMALRSANGKRRRDKRYAQRDKNAALDELRSELSMEIDILKSSLQEKDDNIAKMSGSVKGVQIVKEEKERVLAELMFLSKSFKALQSSLEMSKQSYEDRIQSYEEEAALKETLLLEVRMELERAEEKIRSFEAKVSELTAELVEERRKNENLTAVVTSLTSELDAMRSNVDGFEAIVSILRSEKDCYQRQLSEEQDRSQSLEKKKHELEELISKTKESLVIEKERVAKDISEKESRIARFDSDLAAKMNENMSLKESLKRTTDRYNSEKARVEQLNAQLQSARRNLPLTNADHIDELEVLTNSINDLSKSKDEYLSILSKAESKMKFMTQQLLLSNQLILNKQREVARLKEELSTISSISIDRSRDTLNGKISALMAEVEELKSSARMQKAKGNEKIILVNLKLEEKEADIVDLRVRIDELMRENKVILENKPVADEEGKEIFDLKSSIDTLQTALKDAQMKAQEKIKLKNQSLKEKGYIIEELKSKVIDLQSEKDKLAEKLTEMVKRSEEEFHSHKSQLKLTEERLAKENLVAINAMEKEMSEIVYQLEMEVKLLKKKVTDGDSVGSTTILAQAKRMKNLEDSLRQSKEKEVSLLNENLKMKHRIDNLQFVQVKASKETVAAVPIKSIGKAKEKKIPPYFKEKQQPLVIRVVGNALRTVFRRKKL